MALTGSANLPFPGLTGLKWRNNPDQVYQETRSHLLAGAAGDDAVPGDGDLTEDGESVARDEGELGVTEL